MMGMIDGVRRKGGKKVGWEQIHETDHNETVADTEATQSSGVASSRENIESTPLCRFARWRVKKYYHWLSCTHFILKIATILP